MARITGTKNVSNEEANIMYELLKNGVSKKLIAKATKRSDVTVWRTIKKIEEQETQKKETEERRQHNERCLQEIEDEIMSLQARNNQNETVIRKFEGEIANLEETIKKIRQEIEHYRSRIVDYHHYITASSVRIEELNEQKEGLLNEVC